jgi:NADH dehydrogenase
VQAAVMERLPGKPLTRDQLRTLAHDNVVGEGMRNLRTFGIAPASIDLIVPEYLRRYRPGGKRRELAV